MSQDSELIARYFDELQTGETRRIEDLCRVYYEKLAAIARHRFGTYPRRVTDEYAVANAVLQDFHRRAQQGEFANVRDPAELLLLLARLARDRVVDEIRHHSAQKRGGGKTRGHSIFTPLDGQSHGGDFDRFQASQETPSKKQIVEDELHQVMSKLEDPMLRTILILRYEGLTNDEIAEQLEVSVATVERKRRRIRDCLAEDFSGKEHPA